MSREFFFFFFIVGDVVGGWGRFFGNGKKRLWKNILHLLFDNKEKQIILLNVECLHHM